MDNLVFISVVRDFEMYNKCVAHNENCVQAALYTIDNREKNEFISVCYNRFLDQYDFSKPAWFVFCHEDFQLQEPLDVLLAKAQKNVLYGPYGAVTKNWFGLYYQWRLVGAIENSSRTGENLRVVGNKASLGDFVETFDCQCLIVHSSLIEKTGLRFDENLSFDLYVEDFGIQAKENYDVASAAMPIQCRHWSSSVAGDRYYQQLAYLEKKWPSACYTSTCSHFVGGGASLLRRFDHAWKNMVHAILRKV